MICEKCGGVNSNDATVCDFCDQPLNNKSEENSKKTFFSTSSTENGRPFININLYNNSQSGVQNPFDSGNAKNKWISVVLCLCAVINSMRESLYWDLSISLLAVFSESAGLLT